MRYWIDVNRGEWGTVADIESWVEEHDLGFSDGEPGNSLHLNSQALLVELAETGFLVVNRPDFLLLSKTLEERGYSLHFSPLTPPPQPERKVSGCTAELVAA